MSSLQTYDTIHDYLVQQWTDTTPLAFENDDFKVPTDPEHWLFVEIVGNFFEQQSIGAETRDANLWREDGQIFIHVMAPRGAGTRQARIYGTQVADLFRGLDIGTLSFRDASIGAGEPGNVSGSYFPLTVTIDWLRDA